MQKANVHLEKRIMIGGIKTEAGKDRRIPIHQAILPLIEKHMSEEGDTLLTREKNGKRIPILYDYFLINYWTPYMKELGMNYTIHYARHTCATMLREAKVEEDIRKVILGHKSDDITDRYTHITDEMLLEAIDKLPTR
jgi:integrase